MLGFALLSACASAPPAAPPAPGKATSPPAVADTHAGAAAITLDKLAAGAVLFDDLGTFRRKVTTRVPEAQTYFDQGLRLLYAFNHDEATRSFAKAAALDPSCAMCFWGASVTLGPNYNVPMLPERSVMAWDALQKAIAAAPSATPVEQALIEALAKRYTGPDPLPPAAMRPHSVDYAAAMRAVAAKFPADDDVQVLFAESLMDIDPWKLWSLDGKPGANTPEIVAALETVLSRSARHPGANHYYIHAIEASPHPEKALPSADRLASLMPGAGHLVHMPAHIYQRVGRYSDASASNRKAAEVDHAHLAKVRPWGYYEMYLGHNYGFLAYSSSMEGKSRESIEASRKAAQALPPSMLEMMPGMDFFAAEPYLAMVRFGKWDELLAERRPDPKYPVMTALYLHAHGMALAARGRFAEARRDHAELSKMASTVKPELAAGNNTARDVITVAARVLEARIAEKEGKPEALSLWADAVALADKLAYSEPADWFYPVRHFHGAALLAARKPAEAEAVYREDLVKNPENGWSLFGLMKSLEGQGKSKEAAAVKARFTKAFQGADISLTATAL